MSTRYLYDGAEYGTEEECIRAIVESTCEYDDEFWAWLGEVYYDSDIFSMLVEMLNDMRTKAKIEDVRTDILDRYSEMICEDHDRVRTMLEMHEVKMLEEE